MDLRSKHSESLRQAGFTIESESRYSPYMGWKPYFVQDEAEYDPKKRNSQATKELEEDSLVFIVNLSIGLIIVAIGLVGLLPLLLIIQNT